ncbi:MAG: hypothetical protein ABI388_10310 [Bacteroidia bacterium]
MKTLNTLMQNIIELTAIIETKYPGLYKNLEETPISIGTHPEKEITTTDLKNYLYMLKDLLEDYMKTHKASNNI